MNKPGREHEQIGKDQCVEVQDATLGCIYETTILDLHKSTKKLDGGVRNHRGA